jgi:LPXTG-site transpeptidase (sortase) family protein
LRIPELNLQAMGRPHLAALIFLPLIVFLASVGATLAFRSDGNGSGPPASLSVAVAPSGPTSPSAAAEPTATPLPDRTSCSEIAGTAYRSDAEREWYQKNCLTATTASTATTTTTTTTTTRTTVVAAAESAGAIYGSADRLRIPRFGLDAPINVREVASDGVMGNPLGPTDVIRYDFRVFPGLGGYPGNGGNTSLAGHVDYRNYGLAVFAPLRNIQVGDRVEYVRGDGRVVVYAVEWIADYPPDADWASLVAANCADCLTLITCNGDFNAAAREYSHRRVVRAGIVQ